MALALWLMGFAIGIAFSVACIWVLIDAVRLVRRVWDYIGEAHERARPMQPEPVTPLPRRTRPPRRPVPERRTARRRIAA